jgi:hypothetical protein
MKEKFEISPIGFNVIRDGSLKEEIEWFIVDKDRIVVRCFNIDHAKVIVKALNLNFGKKKKKK